MGQRAGSGDQRHAPPQRIGFAARRGVASLPQIERWCEQPARQRLGLQPRLGPVHLRRQRIAIGDTLRLACRLPGRDEQGEGNGEAGGIGRSDHRPLAGKIDRPAARTRHWQRERIRHERGMLQARLGQAQQPLAHQVVPDHSGQPAVRGDFAPERDMDFVERIGDPVFYGKGQRRPPPRGALHRRQVDRHHQNMLATDQNDRRPFREIFNADKAVSV